MPPPIVTLTYRIPKTTTTNVGNQLSKFSSLVLDQGELALLKMVQTNVSTLDMGTYLERIVQLTEAVPAFVDAYGTSQSPADWHLETLWAQRIEKSLNTSLLP